MGPDGRPRIGRFVTAEESSAWVEVCRAFISGKFLGVLELFRVAGVSPANISVRRAWLEESRPSSQVTSDGVSAGETPATLVF